MKGLIRNTFYSMENKYQTRFFDGRLFNIDSADNQGTVVLSMITAVQIFIFIANVARRSRPMKSQTGTALN